MRSRFLLLALGALLALAVVLWMRASPGAAVPEPAARSAESKAPEVPPQLAQPQPDEPRVERASVEPAATPAAPAPTAVAAPSTWTGVRVRVVSEEDGQPIARVRVRARSDDEKQSWKEVKRSHGAANEEPITGADGVAELELPAGTLYEIHARHDGEHTLAAKKSLEPGLAALEVRELVITLKTKPDVRLCGRVIDRETNAPIVGARVGRATRWNKIDAEGELLTDSDGRFEFAGQSWRRTVVDVLATGYEVACVPLVPGHETPETALEITLSLAATVRVTVLGAAGDPVPELRVSLSTAQYRFGRPDGMTLINAGWSGDATFTVKTDASGVALITDLPPRMPLEGALHRGREELLRVSEKLTLSPGETRAVEWRIGSGCTIQGVALEVDGRPVADLPVCLEAARMPRTGYFEPITSEPRKTTKTDATGTFQFADVGPGNWWVGPAPAKYAMPKTVEPDAPAALAQVVTVAAGVPRVDVEIRVHRGLTIEGVTVDPTGAPTSFAFITFTRPADNLYANENVNHEDGRFVLGPLEPGEYQLTAQSHGKFVSSESVTAHAGDKDVVLRMRAGGALRGTVVDKATGKPGAADLVVRPHKPVDWSISLPDANDKGRFELDGLAPGLYDIAASTSNGLVGLATGVEVEAGGTKEIRIEVEPGARVRVKYEGPWPSCGISILVGEAPTSADGIEKGTERVFVAPAGSIVARMSNYLAKQTFDLPLTLRVGETRDVVFDGAWK